MFTFLISWGDTCLFEMWHPWCCANPWPQSECKQLLTCDTEILSVDLKCRWICSVFQNMDNIISFPLWLKLILLRISPRHQGLIIIQGVKFYYLFLPVKSPFSHYQYGKQHNSKKGKKKELILQKKFKRMSRSSKIFKSK